MSPEDELMEVILKIGIGRGQFHKPGARKCQRLLKVDETFHRQLVDEALQIRGSARASEVTDPEHVTNWTKPYGTALQFSLKNRTGDLQDFSADHNGRLDGKRFHHADRFPTLAAFVGSLPGAINMRLNVMGPSSGLSPHEEDVVFRDGKGGVDYKVRFHLPLVTNDDVWMLLDGDCFRFTPPYIYYFNNGCIHASQNLGSEERMHLVWDMWLDDAFDPMFRGDYPSPWAMRVATHDQVMTVEKVVPVDSYEQEAVPAGRRLTWDQYCEIAS